nr:9435_t:CDS:2 [Entrophospora candida]
MELMLEVQVTFQIASDLVKHANLADGVINPEDVEAKTAITLSPKSIKKYEFQEFDKIIVKRFYIGPWSLNESLICKKYVFLRVPIPKVMDEILSNCLIHQWPNLTYDDYYLGWASNFIFDEIQKKNASGKIQDHKKYPSARGIMFELHDDEDDADKDGVDKYTAIIRKYTIKHQPRVEYILTPEELSEHNEGNRVILPSKSNFGAADLFVTPDNIFQVTMPKKHPIKQSSSCPISILNLRCKFVNITVMLDEYV